MLNRYYHHDPKNAGSQIHKVNNQGVRRNIQLCGEEKGLRGHPVSKKTCVEFLERDDENPGFLTAMQRDTFEKKAGKEYRKKGEPKKRRASKKKYDPFDKLSDETMEQYATRINELVKKK